MRSKFAWLIAAGLAAPVVSAQGVVERVPNGLTVLGADSTSCRDTLVIESRGESNEEIARIDAGQTIVLEVDRPNVPWVCRGEETRSDTMECHQNTTHVRISRNVDSDAVLFECFGR